MTAAINATCSHCGEVAVRIESSRLVLGLHGEERSNALEFICPNCARPQRMTVGERATRLLAHAGITVAALPSRTADDLTGGRDAPA